MLIRSLAGRQQGTSRRNAQFGGILIFGGLVIFPSLLILSILTVDVLRVILISRQLQRAVDAAALAGALQYESIEDDTIKKAGWEKALEAAFLVLGENGFKVDAPTATAKTGRLIEGTPVTEPAKFKPVSGAAMNSMACSGTGCFNEYTYERPDNITLRIRIERGYYTEPLMYNNDYGRFIPLDIQPLGKFNAFDAASKTPNPALCTGGPYQADELIARCVKGDTTSAPVYSRANSVKVTVTVTGVGSIFGRVLAAAATPQIVHYSGITATSTSASLRVR